MIIKYKFRWTTIFPVTFPINYVFMKIEGASNLR
jgi:hypothetical protein